MVEMTAIVLLLSLAGCRAAQGSFRAIADPVRLARQRVATLSDAEVNTLLAHDRQGMRLCGWKP